MIDMNLSARPIRKRLTRKDYGTESLVFKKRPIFLKLFIAVKKYMEGENIKEIFF